MGATRRNNIIAGAFVLVGVALAVIVSFVLSGGASMRSTRGLVIQFPIKEGAPGIRRGSVVTLGGQEIGKVTAIDFLRENGVPRTVEVEIRVRSDFAIHPNAVVALERPLLGTLSGINIASVGDPSSGPPLGEGGALEGSMAPPGFLAQAGIGTEQIDQVVKIINDLDASVTDVRALLDKTAPEIESAISDARALIKDVRDAYPDWERGIDSSLANVEAGSARIGPLFDSADAAVADARATIGAARATIDENRPAVDRIIDNIDGTVARLRNETAPLLDDTLRSAMAAADQFADATAQFSTFAAEEFPGLRRIFANARLASDQVKLATVEVRAQPWRLLYRPDTKELKSQLLYDSARVYADAVSDLRAATESLRAAAGSPAAQSDQVQRLAAEIDAAYARYREAERAMLGLLRSGAD